MLYESKEEAYQAYRESPEAFFEKYQDHYFNERELISPDWKWYETKYHYNLVENGIVDLLRDCGQQVTGNTVLDVGPGTGHWIDFYHHVLESREIVGVDFSQVSVEKLQERYSELSTIRILHLDISEPEASFQNKFDVVNAIGILFHIVDDARWLDAIRNLCGYLSDTGIAIIGGDFGDRTEELGVARKVRRLADWDAALEHAGARRIALRRFDWFKGGANPGLKNNLLAFARQKPEPS